MRRESRYMCGFCPNNPVLCVDPCFRLYHSELGIGEGYHEQEDDLDVMSEDNTSLTDTDTSQFSMA